MEKLVVMDNELHQKVKIKATKENKSIKDFVGKIVADYLEKEEDK